MEEIPVVCFLPVIFPVIFRLGYRKVPVKCIKKKKKKKLLI